MNLAETRDVSSKSQSQVHSFVSLWKNKNNGLWQMTVAHLSRLLIAGKPTEFVKGHLLSFASICLVVNLQPKYSCGLATRPRRDDLWTHLFTFDVPGLPGRQGHL
jgi:hypothetical protein